jgi:hypothetical protein
MVAGRFDAFTRALSAQFSRRTTALLAFSGLIGTLKVERSTAKKRKKKSRVCGVCQVKKKGKCRLLPNGTPCLGPCTECRGRECWQKEHGASCDGPCKECSGDQCINRPDGAFCEGGMCRKGVCGPIPPGCPVDADSCPPNDLVNCRDNPICACHQRADGTSSACLIGIETAGYTCGCENDTDCDALYPGWVCVKVSDAGWCASRCGATTTICGEPCPEGA